MKNRDHMDSINKFSSKIESVFSDYINDVIDEIAEEKEGIISEGPNYDIGYVSSLDDQIELCEDILDNFVAIIKDLLLT
jgi:hypothetical protein